MSDYFINIIYEHNQIEQALKALNKISGNFPDRPLTLLVLNRDEQLVGTLTDGDIRRKLVDGSNLDDPVSSCMNQDFTYLVKNGLKYHNIADYKAKGIQLLPMVNQNKEIVKIYNLSEIKSILPVEAVIMAGGEGTRLYPLTEDTPKPLLKVGNKAIMQHNIDRLKSFGIEYYSIAIRYLGDQIISYFGNGHADGMNLRFVEEDEPLGTAGALGMVDNYKSETILLINSDVLTTLDYEDFYLDFINHDADISVVTIPYRVKVPYGVLDTNEHEITRLRKKPEYTYYSNAGIYLINRELIRDIPANVPLDFTDFLEKQIMKGKKVVSYPFWGYWLDVGKPEDYENAKKAIQILENY